MSDLLKWRPLKVDQSDVLRVTITGNVNTRIATRYFWIPDKGKQSAYKWTVQDGETLDFDTVLIVSGNDNRLGFACQMVPVDANNPNLYVTLQVQQGTNILLNHHYDLEVADPNIQTRLADGFSLVL